MNSFADREACTLYRGLPGIERKKIKVSLDRIVKNHKGAIYVTSAPGKGTTFKLLFPLIENQTAPELTSCEPLPAGSERILFVDDEKALSELGKRMLESLGYAVTERTSSIEALEAFKAQPDKYDLVITDMTMPNMTGKELARELLRIRPGLPIILCTGFSEMITEEKAAKMGIRAFATKPLSIRDLAETARKLLDPEPGQRLLETGTLQQADRSRGYVSCCEYGFKRPRVTG